MTIESYSLPFHMAKAENSQDVQNRFLMYQHAQTGATEEEARKRAEQAQESVEETEETENKLVDEDGQRGSPDRQRKGGRARAADEAEAPRDDDDGTRGHLIDVLA